MRDLEIEWESMQGTSVEIEMEARYLRGRQSVDEYLRQTVLTNPHMNLIYRAPDGEETVYARSTEELPPEPIEVWIGAFAEPAIDRAARLGDGFLASPHLTPDVARQQLELYWERCDKHGRPRGTAAIRRDVYVGESAGEADATGGAVVRAGHRGFPPEACVVGGVEAVTSALRELEEIGYTGQIYPEHFPSIAGDHAAGLAWTIGYMRALDQALEA